MAHRFLRFASPLVLLGALFVPRAALGQFEETTGQAFVNEARRDGLSIGGIQEGTAAQAGLGGGGNVTSRGGGFGGRGGGARGPVTKPFATANRGPTVSPYLGLFNAGIIGDEIDNFQSFVQPQLRQQELNQQFQQQAQQINRQIQQQGRAIQTQGAVMEQRLNLDFQRQVGRPAFNPGGSRQIMPTGHRTFRGTTLQYYPGRF